MLNRFIFGNLLCFNRIILCILTVSAVQLCKIQRDFLYICALYVELCRHFCADVARRKGQDLFGRVGKGKMQRRGGGWFAREGLSGKRGAGWRATNGRPYMCCADGRRPRRPGDSCPSAGAYGMRPYGVAGFYPAGERCLPRHAPCGWAASPTPRGAATHLRAHMECAPTV